MTDIRLSVAGAAGRMGRAVLGAASNSNRFEIVAALTAPNDPLAGGRIRVGEIEFALETSLDCDCDALIDFTVDGGTMSWVEICREKRIPMVIGATGHSGAEMKRLREASDSIPVIYAPNCSVGIAAIRHSLSKLAAELGTGFDVEIVETHHRHKIDAPSGTALALAQDIANATGRDPDDAIVFGRHGQLDKRPEGQIGVHALRIGDLMSHHEIHFSGPGETVTIKHTAHSRDTFAAGALRAAEWAVDQKPGYYGMGDVLEQRHP